MTEHETCKGCKFNNYPVCEGTIMDDGAYMPIDKLKSGFQCGQKDLMEPIDLSIVQKSELELKVEELELRIEELEAK